MAFKPTNVSRKSCNCHVFRADDFNMYQNIYSPSYIILETEINFQNAVTFVLVKLETKFKVQNS